MVLKLLLNFKKDCRMSARIRVGIGDLCYCGMPFCFSRSPEYQNLPCYHSICKHCYSKQGDKCAFCKSAVGTTVKVEPYHHSQRYKRKVTYEKVFKCKSPGDTREDILWKLNLKPTTRHHQENAQR